MLDQLLNPAAGDDPYRRRASHVDGAWSILTGIGANVAMDRGQTVNGRRPAQGGRHPPLSGRADRSTVMCDILPR